MVALVPITVMGYRCERCGHEWVPRDFESEPAVCPKCKNPYWNRPKSRAMMSYEDFRGKVEKALRAANGPLTWTEIRTTARLPQKFPNNEWVHRLERDIGLTRKRDSNGIIKWAVT